MNLAELKALIVDIEANVKPHNPNPNICFWNIQSNTVFALRLDQSARGCMVHTTPRAIDSRECKDGDVTLVIKDVQA